MNILPKKISEKRLYVKDGVIFKISSKKEEDSCILALNEENCPYITVDEEKRYLSDYFEVGDTYSGDVFKKTIHNEKECSNVTFQTFFALKCEDLLKTLIANNLSIKTARDFKNMLTKHQDSFFPTYMIKGMGRSVDGVEQIDLTESKYTAYLESEVINRAKKEAETTVKKYGFKLSDETKIVIEQ